MLFGCDVVAGVAARAVDEVVSSVVDEVECRVEGGVDRSVLCGCNVAAGVAAGVVDG